MYNTIQRGKTNAPLTHEQLDFNFKISENLKGFSTPDNSFGIVGDEYIIPEHYNITSFTMDFILQEYNDLLVYNNNTGYGYIGHVRNNEDCNLLYVDKNNPMV